MNISEFAGRLNLSTGTVSRALNNRAEVSAETRELVLAKAQELGFSPNANARRLVTGKNRLIRLECPYNPELLSDFYLVELARAVENAARANGYDLLLRLGSQPRDTTQLQAVDGLVLLSAPVMSDDELRILTNNGNTSAVVICEPNSPTIHGASYIYIDTIPGVLEALRHFGALGHKRIGYINSGSPGRYVCDAMPELIAAAGLDWDKTVIVDAGVTVEDGYRAAMDLLRSEDRPTALFARTDVLAAGVIKAAHRLGLLVPEEVSVIGHDNINAAALVYPSLTTVAIDIPEAGALATRALLAMIDKKAVPTTTTLHTHLIIRESTAPCPS